MGILVAICSAAKIADEVFGSSKKIKLFGKFFKNSFDKPPFTRAYVGAAFLAETIYGEKFFSLRSLLVSAIFSSMWLLVFICASVIIYGEKSWIYSYIFTSKVIENFLCFMVFGIFIDYICSCVARAVFLFALDFGVLYKLLMLIFCVIFSAMSFYLIYGVAKAIIFSAPWVNPVVQIFTWIESSLELSLLFETLNDWHFVKINENTFDIKDANALVIYAFPEGMLFLSSLLTAILLFSHVVSHGVFFFFVKIFKRFKILINQASIEQRPLQSAVVILGIFALIPIWLILLFFHYFY